MDIVNNDDNSIYYIIKDLPEDTRAAGRAAVKSFGVKSRFVHFEFFRMTEDQASMGKKGQILSLIHILLCFPVSILALSGAHAPALPKGEPFSGAITPEYTAYNKPPAYTTNPSRA